MLGPHFAGGALSAGLCKRCRYSKGPSMEAFCTCSGAPGSLRMTSREAELWREPPRLCPARCRSRAASTAAYSPAVSARPGCSLQRLSTSYSAHPLRLPFLISLLNVLTGYPLCTWLSLMCDDIYPEQVCFNRRRITPYWDALRQPRLLHRKHHDVIPCARGMEG